MNEVSQAGGGHDVHGVSDVHEVTVYCGRCGNPIMDGDHGSCVRALLLEPPRYCAQCRRRLIVQVLPTGWTARCSAHGDLR